jgi:hypothetical protein
MQEINIEFSGLDDLTAVAAASVKRVARASTRVFTWTIQAGTTVVAAAAVFVAPVGEVRPAVAQQQVARVEQPRARLPGRLCASAASAAGAFVPAPAEVDVADPDYGF